MSLSKVKSGGWGSGEKLTSTDMTAVDANIENALDKRSGQSDTLASTVSLTGTINVAAAGRINASASGAKIQANASGATIEASASGAKIAATASGATIEVNTSGAKILASASGATIEANTSGAKILASASGATIEANTSGAKILASASGASIEASVSGAKVAASASGAYVEANTAGALIRTLSGGRFECGDDDYPTLKSGHAGRTVNRLVHPQIAQISNGIISPFPSSFGGTQLLPHDATNSTRYAASAKFTTVDTTTGAGSRYFSFPLDDYLTNGATLTSVDVSVIGATGHGALPSLMPLIHVVRLSRTGSAVVLHSSGDTVSDTAADVTAYEVAHSIVATCDQNNVIDKSQFTYHLGVYNEGNTNALANLIVYAPKLTMTITDLRPH